MLFLHAFFSCLLLFRAFFPFFLSSIHVNCVMNFPFDPRIVGAVVYVTLLLFHRLPCEYCEMFARSSFVFGEGRSKMADFYALVTAYCVYMYFGWRNF